MKILQERLIREYKKIAETNNVTPELVQELEALQWKFVRDNIAKGHDDYETFENIYLRFLGTFYASEDMLKYIIRAKKRRDAKNTRSIQGK